MFNEEQLYEIAKMYYIEGFTQLEIGKKMNSSRIGISRALKKCLEDGIVQISINNPFSFKEMEEKIKEKFGLKRVKIVSYDDDDKKMVINLAKGASGLMDDIVKNNDYIGIGWGNTLSYINVDSKEEYPNKTFVSLLGGYGNVPIEGHSNNITSKISSSYNAKSMMLLTPSLIENKQMRDMILNDRTVKEVFEMYKKLDCAVIGIGSFYTDQANIYKSGYFSKEDFEEIKNKDICLDLVSSIFLNSKGEEKKLKILDRFIGIGGEDIKKIPDVIAVGGGKDKVYPVYLATKMGYISTLITDEKTGEYMLKN